MWYAAHILTGFRRTEGAGGRIIVEENVLLLEAVDLDTAIEKASQKSIDQNHDNKVSYTHPDRGEVVNLGVRKVVAISNDDLDNCAPPKDGSEITYEVFEFSSDIKLQKYLNSISIEAELWKADT